MGRTRREYAETVGGSITGDGQEWDSATAPNMTNGRITMPYSITIGSGKTAQTFSQLTIWIDGVVSLGPPTPAQIAFMSHFEGPSQIQQFPGYYISAGYTDESGATISDGNYDTGYGVQISHGSIDFTVPFGDPGTAANATPITRITWGNVSSDNPGLIDTDKQVLLSPTNFMIGNTQYDNQGAGWGIGLVSVFGGAEAIPAIGNYTADYFAKVRSDFVGDAHGDMLIQSPSGAVYVAEVGANDKTAFTQVTTLGSQWTFIGAGDYLDEGHEQFLIENTSGGVLVVDTENGPTATFTSLATLGAGSKLVATGDFHGEGRDQFLIENPSGAVFLGQVGPTGAGTYTELIKTLGLQWSFIGTGDFLSEGHDQFLLENSSGAVLLGDDQNGTVKFAQIATLGTGWKFDGAGAFLGTPGAGPSMQTDFLIENPSGVLFLGEVGTGDKVTYTQVGAINTAWTVVSSGDYLGEGHDQFLIEAGGGAVIVGDFTGGALHKTLVADLAANWTIHG